MINNLPFPSSFLVLFLLALTLYPGRGRQEPGVAAGVASLAQPVLVVGRGGGMAALATSHLVKVWHRPTGVWGTKWWRWRGSKYLV